MTRPGAEHKRQIYVRGRSDKRCGRCGERLPFDSFRPDARSASGWSSSCRNCAAAANREWRERNPDRIEAYNARRRLEYAEAHRDARKRTCSECGGAFTGRPNRQTCSPECRKARKARLDTRWPKAA
jgi:hypothetical protein